MEGFSVELVTEGKSAIIIVSGELDISTVGKFSELANTTLLRTSTRKLIVDLHQVTFLDSTGLGRLIDLRGLAESEAKRFELRSISRRVSRFLELSGMGNYFPTSPSGTE